ncbi:FAD/FMN-containing dehydrogenase [Klenkia soli]|uniref:FAD/FMN-containing dehydrogenase n=1 Tax=Klenkia soli TaxID=1052260 RepID=A0A1H0KG75_9ACTN|nr:FAD-binding oxidoreductase [Klenkia soli]SDO54905.1 FAD/FMN-containing dehydrogenase [Klenkia soli]
MTATVPATALSALESELAALLGERNVSTELRVRERVSVDGSRMSPIISELLPLGVADLVAFPTTADQIGLAVAAAVRLGVPVTPRGKGTGNYGQGIPMSGGLVLDLSRARAVVEVVDGLLTAEAGTPMVTCERAAQETGQQLWMYPSTVQSSLGGFLAGGSGGTGSIVHGTNDAGFVAALDVVFADGSGELVHVEGEEAQAFVHNYGTAGIIARATVRLEPLQEWCGFYASFPDFHGAQSVLRDLGALQPTPRLISADTPEISAALPEDPAFPAGRASVRGILEVSTTARATQLVEAAGGRLEDVREGPQVPLSLSVLSYNHPIEWLQKSAPGVYFHLEVGGEALIDRVDEVHAVFEGGLLHNEIGHSGPIGMLAGVYRSPEQVAAGILELNALGVGVHDPHQWNVDFQLERTVETARRTDPQGLLNPGKLNPGYGGPTKGAVR